MIEPDHCAEAVGRTSASAQGRDSVLGGHLVCAASLNAGAMAWLTLWASNSPCHREGLSLSVTGLGVLCACLVTAAATCKLAAWCGLKKRDGRITAPAEDDVPRTRCWTSRSAEDDVPRTRCWTSRLMDPQTAHFMRLSGDIRVCYEAVTGFLEENPSRPVGDPGTWVTLRARLVALAAELDAPDFEEPLTPHPPPLPQADKIVPGDVVQWRDYLVLAWRRTQNRPISRSRLEACWDRSIRISRIT